MVGKSGMNKSVWVLGLCMWSAATVQAAANPSQKCQGGKNDAAGKYAACTAKAERGLATTGDTAKYDAALLKCEEKLLAAWDKLESAASAGGDPCPATGDVAAIKGFVDACVISIAGANAGDGLGPDPIACDADLGTCVDDLASCASELSTAGSDLGICETELTACEADLAACSGQQLPATGQTIDYGPGSDGAVQAGATLSYVDNGDGTITDTNTGLMWEKKIKASGAKEYCYDGSGPCADPHDVDNAYPWSISYPGMNGPLVTVFLEQMNNRCDKNPTIACTVDADCSPVPGGACGFAGHRDWRIPNLKELMSLFDMGATVLDSDDPLVSPAFSGTSCGVACTDIEDPACSCTASGGDLSAYWSSTSANWDGGYEAFHVLYLVSGFGQVGTLDKNSEFHARAVRGGL